MDANLLEETSEEELEELFHEEDEELLLDREEEAEDLTIAELLNTFE